MLNLQRKYTNKQEDAQTEKVFLSYVSHRIRTPLNSVIGFSKLLMNKNLDKEKAQVFAERILDSGYEILHYFQNIMDLSELESDMITVNPSHFDINQCIESLVSEFADRFQNERNININFRVLEYINRNVVETDEFLFKRIISNLIELLQMTIHKGEINISYIDRDDGYVNIFLRGESEEKINPVDTSFLLNDLDWDDADIDNVEYLTYKTSSKLSKILGGSCQLENKYEKGMLFSVKIPKNSNTPINS